MATDADVLVSFVAIWLSELTSRKAGHAITERAVLQPGAYAFPQVGIGVFCLHRRHPGGRRDDVFTPMTNCSRSAADAACSPSASDSVAYLDKLLFATGVLLATALFFGVFFIYPADPHAGEGRGQAARHDGVAQRALGNAGAGGADRRPDRHAEPALFRRCAAGISRGVPPHRASRSG